MIPLISLLRDGHPWRALEEKGKTIEAKSIKEKEESSARIHKEYIF